MRRQLKVRCKCFTCKDLNAAAAAPSRLPPLQRQANRQTNKGASACCLVCVCMVSHLARCFNVDFRTPSAVVSVCSSAALSSFLNQAVFSTVVVCFGSYRFVLDVVRCQPLKPVFCLSVSVKRSFPLKSTAANMFSVTYKAVRPQVFLRLCF